MKEKKSALSNLHLPELSLLPRSVISQAGSEFGLAWSGRDLRLVILSARGSPHLRNFDGTAAETGDKIMLQAPRTARNAAALRAQVPWLNPTVLRAGTSFGMGDRLGVATCGHIQAMRKAGRGIQPVFAQQSVRENTRTGRTPQQVLDDAMWGVFQEGWRDGFGADADHLKTTEDIDAFLASGYTWFTFDPGEWVNHSAQTAGQEDIFQWVGKLPAAMSISANGLLGKKIRTEHALIEFTEEVLLRAMAKYGSALWHVSLLYQHLQDSARLGDFEVEISFDETPSPTSFAEHAYLASELRRLGVQWRSLAPRFVGRFEKGVDYIGDRKQFFKDICGHAAIARAFGNYRISLHSGSDKYSIYPDSLLACQGNLHVKTAGTSYLEALRTLAAVAPELLKEIYAFARQRFEEDRQSYHVSADLSNAPEPGEVDSWSVLLEQFDARQILHVTFGSVLRAAIKDGSPLFQERLMDCLRSNLDLYHSNLRTHFVHHLQSLTAAKRKHADEPRKRRRDD